MLGEGALRHFLHEAGTTPTLQFIGSLDTVVEEGRSRGLEERSENPIILVHPGGHYVPVNKQFVMPLVGFIRQCCEDGNKELTTVNGQSEVWQFLV